MSFGNLFPRLLSVERKVAEIDVREPDAPYVNVTSYGASPNKTAALNRAAMQAALDSGEAAVYVPGVDIDNGEFYAIDQHLIIPSNIEIFGDGPRSFIKNTGSSAPAGYGGASNFWDNVLVAGNYGAETSDTYGALWALTYYGINAVSQGTTTITFDTAGDSANFTASDVVFIKSGATFTATVGGKSIPKYVMTNKVKSVGSGTLVLEYPLNHDFDATASIATDAETFTGLDGSTSYIARNVIIRDLMLETTNAPNWSVMHLSCINSQFENLVLIPSTSSGIGANPMAYCKFRNIEVRGMADEELAAFEVVHLNNNIDIDGVIIQKGQLNLGECGSNINAQNIWIGDGFIATARKHRVTIRNATIENTSSLAADKAGLILARETEYNLADNVKIYNPGASTYGVIIGNDSIGHRIINSTIYGSATSGYSAVLIESTAREYQVSNNAFGLYGSRGEQDFIKSIDAGQNGKIFKNISLLSRSDVNDADFSTDSTASEVVRKTMTTPGGSFRKHSSMRIIAFGNVSGTNDAKTIRLRCSAYSGNPAAVTISYTAGQTGQYRIEALVACSGYDGAGATSGLPFNYFYYGAGVTLTGQAVYTGNADLRSDWTITLTSELASASDTVTVLGFYVEQLNDQWKVS